MWTGLTGRGWSSSDALLSAAASYKASNLASSLQRRTGFVRTLISRLLEMQSSKTAKKQLHAANNLRCLCLCIVYSFTRAPGHHGRAFQASFMKVIEERASLNYSDVQTVLTSCLPSNIFNRYCKLRINGRRNRNDLYIAGKPSAKFEFQPRCWSQTHITKQFRHGTNHLFLICI